MAKPERNLHDLSTWTCRSSSVRIIYPPPLLVIDGSAAARVISPGDTQVTGPDHVDWSVLSGYIVVVKTKSHSCQDRCWQSKGKGEFIISLGKRTLPSSVLLGDCVFGSSDRNFLVKTLFNLEQSLVSPGYHSSLRPVKMQVGMPAIVATAQDYNHPRYRCPLKLHLISLSGMPLDRLLIPTTGAKS